MATLSAKSEARAPLFPYERWSAQLPQLAAKYQAGQPFPNIHLPDFLDADVARQLAAEFPAPRDAKWIHYKHYNENKLGQSNRAAFPPLIGQVIDELTSPAFVAWISQLIGIPGLLADPGLEGGGMHQTERGGFLNMHADFTMHHYHKNWRRRCNLILYLNEDWLPEWGGALEFWDRQMQHCVSSYLPLLNHAVVFNTTEESYHGYPDPIQCPPEVTRKSLALYYYTPDDSPRPVAKSTRYQARPVDSRRRLWIWLDTKAIQIYSSIKARLGLSDDLASRILGFFSRKKRDE